jgi:hypothetical protein
VKKALLLGLLAGLLVGVALYGFELRVERGVGRRRDSGYPGGGQGRVDEIGPTGVYPASARTAPGDARTQDMASWGQGE